MLMTKTSTLSMICRLKVNEFIMHDRLGHVHVNFIIHSYTK